MNEQTTPREAFNKKWRDTHITAIATISIIWVLAYGFMENCLWLPRNNQIFKSLEAILWFGIETALRVFLMAVWGYALWFVVMIVLILFKWLRGDFK